MMKPVRSLFLSHGGGPLPLLGEPNHHEMIATLDAIGKQIAKPRAIIVISAHWEAATVKITAHAKPDLIYDYYGFAREAYDLKYPCVGEPELAQQVLSAFKLAEIEAELDSTRGYDHGMFVPLMLMYPQADIPCIQISLQQDLSATKHLQIGQALATLPNDDLLIIGSGFSYHNMRGFGVENAGVQEENEQFNAWLVDTMMNKTLNEAERVKRLKNWSIAPSARACHPREEHLLPLHVCYGLMGRPASEHFAAKILQRDASFFLW
ncbi:MAG: dioxygenase [Gammaproteobacteria bacterium]|nr:dioxygenase [Gammaproteobacteria bacterium]